MTTMAKVGLPVRKFNVDLIKKGRGHWYQVTSLMGEPMGIFPGVTGYLGVIAKPALIPWATKEALKSAETALLARLKGKDKARVELTPEWIAEVMADAKARPDQIKQEAADLGTMAHQVIDRIVNGEEIKDEDIPEAVRAPVSNFMTWLKESRIEMVMGDTRVASVAEKFGGSLDALGWKDGRYVLLDWKTSSGIYTEYGLQVAAYATAFEETFGVPIGEAYIVRFDKKEPVWDPQKDVKRVSNLTVSYGAFAAAKTLKEALEEPHFDE